ncbi:MAG: response regulator [Pseudomonadota bacterium]
MARILVVDDSPTETHRMVNTLAGQGHQVLTAATGKDGIEMATAEQPDIILMDVVMPGMNGFQATRQITRGESTNHIPVVIVSSKAQVADKVWGERQGACGYLTKPVDERTLINTVNGLLD